MSITIENLIQDVRKIKELHPYAPCERLINGHRLTPVRVDDLSDVYVWRILPNRSDRVFYFPSLTDAENFAKSFENLHTNSFWFSRWRPLYSFECAKKNVKGLWQ